jgi:hypothetical protein
MGSGKVIPVIDKRYRLSEVSEAIHPSRAARLKSATRSGPFIYESAAPVKTRF